MTAEEQRATWELGQTANAYAIAKLATTDEVDGVLNLARTVLRVKRERGGIIELHRVRKFIDDLLDRRLQLAGPPVCEGPGCGRVKSRFGAQMFLCSECDFLTCANDGCDRRVLALDALTCNPCRGVPYSPWPPL